MPRNDYDWLSEDIESCLFFVVFRQKGDDSIIEGYFSIYKILETAGDNLSIENGNINDISNFLTVAIVRFINMADSHDILDIPLRNMMKVFNLGNNNMNNDNITFENTIDFKELEAFFIIDGYMVTNGYRLFPFLVGKPKKETLTILEYASKFSSSNISEQFNMMTQSNEINRKLKNMRE